MPLTPARPGQIIKGILGGELPIFRQVFEAGQVVPRLVTVTEATVSELHRAYGRRVKEERLEGSQQKGMCYDSFRRYTWMAWQLGFIEQVAEGDPVPAGAGFLLSTRGSWPNAQVVQARSISYALTDRGREEVQAWNDLTKAFKQSLEAPAPAAAAAELPTVPTITLPANFSTRTVPRLLNHLQALADLAAAAEWPGDPNEPDVLPAMTAEVLRLQEIGTDWSGSFQDSLGEEEERDNPSQRRIDALQERIDQLDRYAESLDQQDLPAAIEAMEEIEPLEES